jgi:hypothetical protein
LEAGAFQATVAEEFPATAVTPVGTPGALAGGGAAAEGVIALEGMDAPLSPVPLKAWTTNVYVVPADSPLIVTLVAGAGTFTLFPVSAPPDMATTT